MRHRSELRHGRHHNPYLAKAYNKYGEDKFKVQILEVCEKVQDTLFFLEQKYLDLKPEYNNENGKFIRTHSSKKEAARFFGYENGRFWIKDCIQGKREEAFGFKWRNTYDK